MSVCDYCGEKAGWFQSSHPACVTKANSTAQAVKGLVFNGTVAGKSYDELSTDVEKLLADQKVQFKYVREALLQGINDAASQLALQSPLTDQEFYRLHHILGTHGFDIYVYQAEFESRRWFSVLQCLMSSILWDVLHHRIGPFDGPIEFNLRSGELPIFQTPHCVTYSEERTISKHARCFRGLSVPIGGCVFRAMPISVPR